MKALDENIERLNSKLLATGRESIPPQLVKLLIKEAVTAIFGGIKSVPKPYHILKWAKIGKTAYLNVEEVRKWSGFEQPLPVEVEEEDDDDDDYDDDYQD